MDKYSLIVDGEDGQEEAIGYAELSRAKAAKAQLPGSRIVSRHVRMVSEEGGYVGVLCVTGQRPRRLEVTESNAALICRAKCIEEASRLGLQFRE